MQPASSNHYLLAIIPSEPVLNEVEKFKIQIKEHLVNDGFFSLPPYIKLTKPFLWDNTEEYLLVHYFKNIIPMCYSMQIDLNGFGVDKDNNELYIHVTSQDEIDNIRNLFEKHFINHQGFNNDNFLKTNKNLIIGNGDLKINHLQKAWNKFKDKNYSGAFIADKLCLFQQISESWQLKYTFDLD